VTRFLRKGAAARVVIIVALILVLIVILVMDFAGKSLLTADEDFTINGIIPNTSPLYPGTSQPVDLSITNPNPEALTVASGSLSVGISTTPHPPSTSCPASWYALTKGNWSVSVPAGATRTLSSLGVTTGNLPVISMIETHTDQSACEGATLTFTWGARGMNRISPLLDATTWGQGRLPMSPNWWHGTPTAHDSVASRTAVTP
jgi:hypothetical protein